MVTALCNVFINSEFKLGLFKETFPRVYGVSDNWLVNIRGKYRDDVLKYIREAFPDSEKNCIFFSGLDDSDWAKSARTMLEKSKYDHIYVFLEDHFLLKPLEHFKDVLRDMIDSKIEYFQYSFFDIGLSVRNSEWLYPDCSGHFFSFRFGESDIKPLRKSNRGFYPYSLASVCTKSYFRKLMLLEDKFLVKVPFLLRVVMENCCFFYPRDRAFWFNVNRLISPLGIRFGIYSSATPFNLEKSLFDCEPELLPFRVGGLKEELFANWDDDNKLSNSSLIKRGLYPERLRVEGRVIPNPTDGKEYELAKGQSSNHQYCPDVGRVMNLPMKYIHIRKGSMKVSSSRDSFVLDMGQSAWIAANIPHEFFAREDCAFQVYIESGL